MLSKTERAGLAAKVGHAMTILAGVKVSILSEGADESVLAGLKAASRAVNEVHSSVNGAQLALNAEKALAIVEMLSRDEKGGSE